MKAQMCHLALILAVVFSCQVAFQPLALAQQGKDVEEVKAVHLEEVADLLNDAGSIEAVFETEIFRTAPDFLLESCPKIPLPVVGRMFSSFLAKKAWNCAKESLKKALISIVPRDLSWDPTFEVRDSNSLFMTEKHLITIEGDGILVGESRTRLSRSDLLQDLLDPRKHKAFLTKIENAVSHQRASLFETILGIKSAHAGWAAVPWIAAAFVLVGFVIVSSLGGDSAAKQERYAFDIAHTDLVEELREDTLNLFRGTMHSETLSAEQWDQLSGARDEWYDALEEFVLRTRVEDVSPSYILKGERDRREFQFEFFLMWALNPRVARLFPQTEQKAVDLLNGLLKDWRRNNVSLRMSAGFVSESLEKLGEKAHYDETRRWAENVREQYAKPLKEEIERERKDGWLSEVNSDKIPPSRTLQNELDALRRGIFRLNADDPIESQKKAADLFVRKKVSFKRRGFNEMFPQTEYRMLEILRDMLVKWEESPEASPALSKIQLMVFVLEFKVSAEMYETRAFAHSLNEKYRERWRPYGQRPGEVIMVPGHHG